MARLRRTDGTSPTEVTLSALTRIGRADDNDLVIEHPLVSQVHASIAWASPGVWELRDLGSSNGSFVDGVRVRSGERRALGAGVRIAFGIDAPQWELVDAERPFPEARDLASGERLIGMTNLLTLGANEATADIFEETRGNWVVEQGGVVRDVRHGEVLEFAGRRYKVSLPLPLPETEDAPAIEARAVQDLPLGDTTLTFFVSADLESVELRVTWTGKNWNCHKAYARALLVLAEARQRDGAAGTIRPHEQGWVYNDELCTLATYESVGRLNVEIHRARAEFARAGIPGAPAIVQRRRGTGQMRLGTNRIEIVHGLARPAS